MTAALLTLLWLAGVAPQTPSNSVFQTENAKEGQFSFRDGVLKIESGRGWLRTPRLYSDFSLSLKFRTQDDRAAADLVLRALVPQRGAISPAYRIPLLQLLSATPGTAVTPPKNAVKVIKEGRVDARPTGEWQRLDVSAIRESLTVSLNGALVGEYRIDRLAGYLLISPRQGRVQMRNIDVTALDMPFAPPAGTLTMTQVKQAGGVVPHSPARGQTLLPG